MLYSAKSQDTERAIKKGQNSVNVYYGYRLWPAFIQNLSKDDKDFQLRFCGPIGIVYEHLLTNMIGLGIEGGYGQINIVGDYQIKDSSGATMTFRETLTVTNTRIMGRANFHFLRIPNFDLYGLVSLGYRSTIYRLTDTNPNAEKVEPTKGWLPVGIKPGIGCRYFFSSPFGLHLEFAAGTPAIAGGINVRF